MITMIILAVLNYIVCGFGVPYCLYNVVELLSPGKGTAGKANMLASALTATLERSKTHILEKVLVFTETLLFLSIWRSIINSTATADSILATLFFIALLLLPEFLLAMLSKDQLAFCWAISLYSKALNEQNKPINRQQGNKHSENRQEFLKDYKEYIESKDRKVIRDIEKRREFLEGNYFTPQPDGELGVLTTPDILKAVSKFTNKLQETVILSSVTDISRAHTLVGNPIFSNNDSKVLDIRLDNAIYDGAVHIAKRLSIPCMAMDLNLMRIIKQPEIEMFNSSIPWTTDILPGMQFNKFWEDIDRFMTLGIKKVKITMWFKGEDSSLNCLKFEFASNILHKEILRDKLIKSVTGLSEQLQLVNYDSAEAFFITDEIVALSQDELRVMVEHQETCDYIVNHGTSKYMIPNILRKMCFDYERLPPLNKRPTNKEKLISDSNVGVLHISTQETSNGDITAFKYVIEKDYANTFYKRAKGCMPLDFTKTYRVTKLKDILGVLVNTQDVIKTRGNFILVFGMRVLDVWISVSCEQDLLGTLDRLSEDDDIIKALYFSDTQNLMLDYKAVSYMYIMWDLNLGIDYELRYEHDKVRTAVFSKVNIDAFKLFKVIEGDSCELSIDIINYDMSETQNYIGEEYMLSELPSAYDKFTTRQQALKSVILRRYDDMHKGGSCIFILSLDIETAGIISLIKMNSNEIGNIYNDIDYVLEDLILDNVDWRLQIIEKK